MEIEIQLLPLFLRVSVFLHNVDSVIPSQQPDTACSLKPFSKWQVLDGIAERIQPSAARSARWFRRAPLVRSRAMTRLTPMGRRGIAPGSWWARMIERKPKMLVAIVLANKMARQIWALLTKQEDYRNPTQMGAA